MTLEISISPERGVRERHSYISALNALRGFAAIYVVIYHLRYFTDFDWFGEFPAIRFGYIGVDFFFILSGLIISHVYLEKSRSADTMFWTNFIWLRFARLFPVHLLIMALMLTAALIGPYFNSQYKPINAQQLWDWFSLSFLFRQWLLPDGYAWNAPAWSVSAELFAYLLIFPVVCRFGRARRAMTGLTLILTGTIFWIFLVFNAGTVNVIQGPGPLIRVCAGFLAGSGLFILLSSTAAQKKRQQLNWNIIYTAVFLAGVPVWSLALWMQAAGVSPDLLLISYLVMLICVTYCGVGKISSILASKPLFWLGEISFSLYLCHVPILSALSYLAVFAEIESGGIFGFWAVVVSIIVAHLLFLYVEMPARRWLRNLWPGKSRHSEVLLQAENRSDILLVSPNPTSVT